jgi:hypothetical protein
MRTAQTLSYNNNGEIVNDRSIKDDGYYMKGFQYNLQRDDTNRVVTDIINNNLWKDDEYISKPWLSNNSFIHGNYDDTQGDTASNYCTDLSDLGRQWRLPTLKELLKITLLGDINLKIPAIFRIVSTNPDGYWSSTSKEATPIIAWNLNYSSQKNLPISTAAKNQNSYVRCINGEENTVLFSRDDEVVTDEKTLLIWQDNTITTSNNWEQAINYCESLTLKGYNDWRLPNINELLSITAFHKSNPSIYNTFSHTQSSQYWSSTSAPKAFQKSWNIDFSDAKLLQTEKNSTSINVRCVRN